MATNMNGLFQCPHCTKSFTYKKNLYRHMREHQSGNFVCALCNKQFHRNTNLLLHYRSCLHRHRIGPPKIEYAGGAFNNTIETFTQHINDGRQNPYQIMNILHRSITANEKKIKTEVNRKKSIKFYISAYITFVLAHDSTHKTEPPVVLNSTPQEILLHTDIRSKLDLAYNQIAELCEIFELNGSGFILHRLEKVLCCVVEYKPLRGGAFHPLHPYLTKSDSIVDIPCSDNKCFIWAIIKCLYFKDTPITASIVDTYMQYFNFKGIEFPVKIKDIKKFETNNGLSISVFGFENQFDSPHIYPIKISENRTNRHIDLLYLDNRHFCLISKFHKLISKQYSKHQTAMFFCRFCLNGFTSERILTEHMDICKTLSCQLVVYPTDPILSFKNTAKRLIDPFVVYGDFECLLRPHLHKTTIQKHEISSYGYHIVSTLPGMVFTPRLFTGHNAGVKFLDNLLYDFYEYIQPVIKRKYPIRWSPTAIKKFYENKICGICRQPLLWGVQQVVADHDHMLDPDKFENLRFSAHNICNINLRRYTKRYQLKIFFQAGGHYDFHYIVRATLPRHGRLNVIATSTTNYITLSVGSLLFMDSFKFLNMSLDKASQYIVEEDYHHLRRIYPNKFQHLTQKGIYPYSYVTDFSKFSETSLPGIDAFTNTLTGEKLSLRNYERAHNIWKTFNCQNFGDYHNLYLLSDILILSDIFEKFRKKTYLVYNLDSVNYPTLASLGYDAMLSYTNISLERLTCPDMFLMVERNIRGGISIVNHRFCTANHPSMESFDKNLPTSTLLFFDINALYSHAMTKYLPVGDYEWVDQPPHNLFSLPENSPKGYFLEVSLEYPAAIHDFTDGYPLCPEHIEITQEMLSPFQKTNWPEMKHSEIKLTPNLRNKQKILCHYTSLQLWVRLGMKITKYHRILKFTQSDFLRTYIDYNMGERELAIKHGDKFSALFHKQISNVIYGKMIENKRNRQRVELINDKKTFLKKTSKASFKAMKIINEHLVSVSMLPTKCVLDRCISIGFSILEISKKHMYEFHYDIMKKAFKDPLIILSDTDSLCYLVQEDAYPKLHQIRQHFDFSNYDPENPLYGTENLGKHRKMKDEIKGELLYGVVALRPKLYCLSFAKRVYYIATDQGFEETEKPLKNSIMRRVITNRNLMKGVSQAAKNKFTFQQYHDCLTTLKTQNSENYRIGQINHEMFTFKETKISLTPFDNKRWLIDEVKTLAHGHYSTISPI